VGQPCDMSLAHVFVVNKMPTRANFTDYCQAASVFLLILLANTYHT